MDARFGHFLTAQSNHYYHYINFDQAATSHSIVFPFANNLLYIMITGSLTATDLTSNDYVVEFFLKTKEDVSLKIPVSYSYTESGSVAFIKIHDDALLHLNDLVTFSLKTTTGIPSFTAKVYMLFNIR